MTPRTMIWLSVIVTLFMIAIIFIKPLPRYYTFNKEQAKKDIINGQVRLITFGLGGVGKKADRLSTKYGFKECNMGCVVEYSQEEKEYTELITAFLNNRNGEGWRERYSKELDSLKR
jgi:hypothetical protein